MVLLWGGRISASMKEHKLNDVKNSCPVRIVIRKEIVSHTTFFPVRFFVSPK